MSSWCASVTANDPSGASEDLLPVLLDDRADRAHFAVGRVDREGQHTLLADKALWRGNRHQRARLTTGEVPHDAAANQCSDDQEEERAPQEIACTDDKAFCLSAFCLLPGQVRRVVRCVRRRGPGIVRPRVLRIAAAQLLSHLGIGSRPEAPQVARGLDRPAVRREQLEDDRLVVGAEARRVREPEQLLQLHRRRSPCRPRCRRGARRGRSVRPAVPARPRRCGARGPTAGPTRCRCRASARPLAAACRARASRSSIDAAQTARDAAAGPWRHPARARATSRPGSRPACPHRASPRRSPMVSAS